MQSKLLVVALAGLLPFAPVVSAQEAGGAKAAASAAPVATEATDDDGAGAYSLRGSAVESAGGMTRQGAVTPSYELFGTSIGGSRGSSQVILTAPAPERGAPIRTESGIFFYPSVFVGYGVNDNVGSTPTNQVRSNLTTIAPEVVAEMKSHGDRYTAVFTANSTSYASSRDDNYTNYEAWVAGDNYFSARARMGWAVGTIVSSDPRGSKSNGISASPDRWHAPTLRGKFIYGAQEAAGRIEVDVDVKHKRYDNNQVNTETLSLNDSGIAGRFFYRVGSRSMALLEVRNHVFDYTSPNATDDNTDRRVYLGYTWEATAATTGIVKVGRMTKRFDLAGKERFSGSTWEATVRWLPRTYSAFEFESSKTADDPTGVGNYLENTNNTLSWNHQWSGSFTTVASAGVLKSKFAGTGREDDIQRMSITANYALRRWMSIGVDFANTNTKSNQTGLDWKRNVTMFNANFTL
jgi:hypothetical protein